MCECVCVCERVCVCYVCVVLYTSCEQVKMWPQEKRSWPGNVFKEHAGWTNIFIYESISKPQILSRLTLHYGLLSQSTASFICLRITWINSLLFLRVIIIIIIITTCWEPLQSSWETILKTFNNLNTSPLWCDAAFCVHCTAQSHR